MVRHDLRVIGDGVVRRRVEYRPLDPAAPRRSDRTVPGTVIGQVEFADVVLPAGPAPDAWTQVRTRAVLALSGQRVGRHWRYGSKSGGNGLVGLLGPWLSTSDAAARDRANPTRPVMAALDWDPYYGDRRVEIVVISPELPAAEVSDVLRSALLTDADIAAGAEVWREHDDPFGDWQTKPHSGPNSDVSETDSQTAQQRREKP